MNSNLEFVDKHLGPEWFERINSSKIGHLDELEANFMHNFIAKHIAPRRAIEFSSASGGSTCLIGSAMEKFVPKREWLISYESNPFYVGDAKKAVKDAGLDYFVQIIEGDVLVTMNYKKLEAADLLFIDSDHSEEFVKAYIKNFLTQIRPGCWIGVHDIRFGKEGNPESRLIWDYVRKAKKKNYFYIPDLLKYYKIKNPPREPCRNPSFWFEA